MISIVFNGSKFIEGLHISFRELMLDKITFDPDFIPSTIGSPKLSTNDGRIT